MRKNKGPAKNWNNWRGRLEKSRRKLRRLKKKVQRERARQRR